ncbi:MAG: hypothetical protein LC104_14065 [Bacteroidales bacterium]|nr:hypothetical protein [Bacteroidales bacterium]
MGRSPGYWPGDDQGLSHGAEGFGQRVSGDPPGTSRNLLPVERHHPTQAPGKKYGVVFELMPRNGMVFVGLGLLLP